MEADAARCDAILRNTAKLDSLGLGNFTCRDGAPKLNSELHYQGAPFYDDASTEAPDDDSSHGDSSYGDLDHFLEDLGLPSWEAAWTDPVASDCLVRFYGLSDRKRTHDGSESDAKRIKIEAVDMEVDSPTHVDQAGCLFVGPRELRKPSVNPRGSCVNLL